MDLIVISIGVVFGVGILYVLLKGVAAFGSGLKEGFETTEINIKPSNRPYINKQTMEKQAWLDASSEIQNGHIDQALWAKAFAECDGDQRKQQAKYLSLRQREIFDRLLKDAKRG